MTIIGLVENSEKKNVEKKLQVLDKNYSIENIRLLFLVKKWSNKLEFSLEEMQIVLKLEEDMNSILHDIEFYLNFLKDVNTQVTEGVV
jgi:cysteinyl-tRNA synthetase